MTNQWLSISEYARSHSLSDMTVRRRIKTGKLHAVLREGKYFIPTNDKLGVMPQHATRPISTPSENPARSFINFERSAPPIAIPQPSVNSVTMNPALTKSDAGTVFAQDAKVLNRLSQTCENAIRHLEEAKNALNQRYESTIQALEAKLAQKSSENERLQEKVTDLELLLRKVHEFQDHSKARY